MGRISVGRVAFYVCALAVAAVVGWFFGDDLRIAEKPSEYIGVTFSILAASLFAVVSIVGDPSMLLPGNWRVGSESSKNIQIELQKFNLLFVWYLLTLALLVATELVESAGYQRFYFLFNVFGFFAAFGFIASMRLPYDLARIQRNRLQQEIEQRRASK